MADTLNHYLFHSKTNRHKGLDPKKAVTNPVLVDCGKCLDGPYGGGLTIREAKRMLTPHNHSEFERHFFVQRLQRRAARDGYLLNDAEIEEALTYA